MNVPSVNILLSTAGIIAGQTWRGTIDDSNNPYAGFSLCTYTGDTESHCNACLTALAEWLEISEDHIFVPRQVHGTELAVITSDDFDHNNGLDGVDAIICTIKGIAVGINTADCIPIIIVDESRSVVSAIHAGWRGAVNGIVRKTVDAMLSIGCTKLKAIVGAGICQDCFEVGDEVACRFPNAFVRRIEGKRPHVDLKAYVVHDLRSSGINDIKVSGDCTRCEPLRYFSARASGLHSGRNFMFVMLRPDK